jgi:hypothetical protein
MAALLLLSTWFSSRLNRDEAGNVITDNLAWIVFGVVAVVAIGALLKSLGASVVAWVSSQLGI